MKILSSIGAFVLEILQTIVISLLIFFIIYVFIAQPFQVKGDSMLNNYHDGEYLLVSKLSYRFGNPKEGDVIVFEYPNSPQYDYIKRIIATPEKTVSVKQGKVYLDGFPLEEPYLSPDITTLGKAFLKEGVNYTLSDNEYFVMGDNRERSSDSRTWGVLPKKNIIGKAVFRYWPLSKIGIL